MSLESLPSELLKHEIVRWLDPASRELAAASSRSFNAIFSTKYHLGIQKFVLYCGENNYVTVLAWLVELGCSFVTLEPRFALFSALKSDSLPVLLFLSKFDSFN